MFDQLPNLVNANFEGNSCIDQEAFGKQEIQILKNRMKDSCKASMSQKNWLQTFFICICIFVSIFILFRISMKYIKKFVSK